MTTAVRHKDITNPGGALIPSGNPLIICNTGQDYCFQTVERTFIAAEIGTAAGETQDTTSNPTIGFLFAQFQGVDIKKVVGAVLKKQITGTHITTFENIAWTSPSILAGDAYNLGFRFVNPYDAPTTPGYHPNYASLYLLDTGGDANNVIAVGDKVMVIVQVGGIVAS